MKKFGTHVWLERADFFALKALTEAELQRAFSYDEQLPLDVLLVLSESQCKSNGSIPSQRLYSDTIVSV